MKYQDKDQPPRLALSFLHWFCDPQLLEDVEGDLLELYRERTAVHKVKAKWLFCVDVFLLLRPGIIRNFTFNSLLTTIPMLSHHIKTTFRQVWKFKGYSAINLSGLVVGLASCLLIMLWVIDEINMDKFHDKSNRIYQVWRNMIQSNGEVITTRYIPQPLENVLKQEYPEVENVTTVSWLMESLFRLDEKTSYENGFYASPGFFQIFSFPFVAGNPVTALDELNSVIVSERLARSYFGDRWEDAVGQILKIDERQEFVITGIFKDTGVNSSLRFDWVLPAKEFNQRNEWVESWFNGGCSIYFSVKEGADMKAVQKRIEQEINKHTDNAADEPLFLQRFAENYLYGGFENGVPAGGRIEYVKILSAIAAFILLIACINFMNLASARSSTRAREIGVRKVMGARKGSLTVQFYVESFMHTLASVFIAILIVYFTLPYFNTLTGKSLFLDIMDPSIAIAIISVILVTGFLSGSYPALLLSSFGIINALKGKSKSGANGARVRQGLATFQFAVSIFLICGTLVVSRQMDYVMNKDLGLDKENLIMVGMDGELAGRNEVYRNALQEVPEVKGVTFASGNPVSYGNSTGGASWEGKNPDDNIEINVLNIDGGFLETTGVSIAQGRTFSNNLATDSLYFLVNEVLADIMAFRNPIGKRLSCWGIDGTISGVVKNFHMSNLHDPIAPLIIRYDPENTGLALIRVHGSTQKAIERIGQVTKKLNPAFPFRYEFMDEGYAQSYKSEVAVSTLLDFFAMVCIFISCLGLLGLSSFSADQRAKEIGIRKVLGARVFNLVMMLSRDYARLMIIAFVIAIPVSYYYMQHWLQSFAFRTNMSLDFFVVSGLVAFLFGGFTVGLKSYLAATANPTNTLKEE